MDSSLEDLTRRTGYSPLMLAEPMSLISWSSRDLGEQRIEDALKKLEQTGDMYILPGQENATRGYPEYWDSTYFHSDGLLITLRCPKRTGRGGVTVRDESRPTEILFHYTERREERAKDLAFELGLPV